MCCVDYMRTDHACMYKDLCNMARVLLLMCMWYKCFTSE